MLQRLQCNAEIFYQEGSMKHKIPHHYNWFADITIRIYSQKNKQTKL